MNNNVKSNNKKKKLQNDINEEQILKYVQKEFIKAYICVPIHKIK